MSYYDFLCWLIMMGWLYWQLLLVNLIWYVYVNFIKTPYIYLRIKVEIVKNVVNKVYLHWNQIINFRNIA